VVFAEGEEEKVIRAAIAYINSGYGTPVLVGREERINATATSLGDVEQHRRIGRQVGVSRGRRNSLAHANVGSSRAGYKHTLRASGPSASRPSSAGVGDVCASKGGVHKRA
jgi:hypothetical protein